MIRLRDVVMLATTGQWYGQDENIVLDIDWLLDHTVETDWDPPTADRAAWDAHQAEGGGGNYLNQIKAEAITNELNGV